MKLVTIMSVALLASGSYALAQGNEASGNSSNSGSPVLKNSPTTSQGAPLAKSGGGNAEAPKANDPKNENMVGDTSNKTPQEAVQKGDNTSR